MARGQGQRGNCHTSRALRPPAECWHAPSAGADRGRRLSALAWRKSSRRRDESLPRPGTHPHLSSFSFLGMLSRSSQLFSTDTLPWTMGLTDLRASSLSGVAASGAARRLYGASSSTRQEEQ